MNFFKIMACSIVLIGALNWGLVGLFGFDLVAFLFGEMSILTRIIYIIVGVCGILFGIMAYRCNKEHCNISNRSM